MDGTCSRPVPAAPPGAAMLNGASARLAWVDVAKGACIVLVVLLHVTTRHLVRLGDADQAIVATWDSASEWLRPVRMPLFFLLSGLLAAPALRRRDPVALRRRVVRSFELYVVWMALQALLVDRRLRPGVVTTTLDGFVDALVLPTGNLWYLWALAAYVVALALVPPAWRRPVLVGLGLLWLAVATRHWHLVPRQRDLVQYLVWFAAGAWLPTRVRAIADRFTNRRAMLAAACFVLASAVLAQTGPMAGPVLQVLGVTAGLGVATRARGRVADWLGGLGRRTLSIYVLHVPLLTVWAHVMRQIGWRGSAPVGALLWLYPLALGAALIATSLTIERALRGLGADRLFGDRRRPASLSP